MLTIFQLIRDDLRASTGAEGSEWWRGGDEEARGVEGEQEEAHMDSLEDYVELLYEGKDKVCHGPKTDAQIKLSQENSACDVCSERECAPVPLSVEGHELRELSAKAAPVEIVRASCLGPTLISNLHNGGTH